MWQVCPPMTFVPEPAVDAWLFLCVCALQALSWRGVTCSISHWWHHGQSPWLMDSGWRTPSVAKVGAGTEFFCCCWRSQWLNCFQPVCASQVLEGWGRITVRGGWFLSVHVWRAMLNMYFKMFFRSASTREMVILTSPTPILACVCVYTCVCARTCVCVCVCKGITKLIIAINCMLTHATVKLYFNFSGRKTPTYLLTSTGQSYEACLRFVFDSIGGEKVKPKKSQLRAMPWQFW